jgi:predicted alpha/beta-fold hydrolase
MTDTSPAYAPRPFRAAAWLPGPHAQTVAGRYLRRPAGITYRRERVDTADGDFLDLDFALLHGREPAADAPVAVVVHGLEGSAASGYVVETCRALAEHGIRPVAMNFRTCGGEMNRTLRFYHAGETGDLATVLALLAERFPGAPLGAVGFSLGANVLLKYLGETGDAARVRAAVAVSTPFDLSAGADSLDGTRLGRLYVSVFLRTLKAKFTEKSSLVGDSCDADRVYAARTFREFDDAATAPLHGFTGVDHYYSSSSSAQFIDHIRVPTLLIQSRDDPFLPGSAIPLAAAEANPCVTPVITDHGGHVGFIAGPPWAPRFWAETEAARFLAPHLGGRAGKSAP